MVTLGYVMMYFIILCFHFVSLFSVLWSSALSTSTHVMLGSLDRGVEEIMCIALLSLVIYEKLPKNRALCCFINVILLAPHTISEEMLVRG
jgi:hypothetical protein